MARLIWLVACVALMSGALAGCGAAAPTPPATCDGISAELGGCDARRFTYAGTTCEELADEWGAGVDRWARGIMAEPADVGGQARSVRVANALLVASLDLENTLGAEGRHGECTVEVILDGAQDQFTAELRTGLGGVMYDGEPVLPWDKVLDEMRDSLRILESDPIELPSTDDA